MAIRPYQSGRIREAAVNQVQASDRANADTFGAGMGRAVQQIGSDAQKLAYRQQQIELAEDVQKQKNDANSILNNRRSQMRDQTHALMQKRGKAAENVYKEGQDLFTKEREEVVESGRSPFMKELLGANYDSFAQSHLETLKRHETQEIENFRISGLQGGVKESTMDFVDAAANGSQQNMESNTIDIIAKTADLNKGKDPGYTKAMVEMNLSNANASAVDTLIRQGNLVKAQELIDRKYNFSAYSEQGKDALEGIPEGGRPDDGGFVIKTEQREILRKKLHTANVAEAGRSLTEDIVGDPDLKPSEWIAEVEKTTAEMSVEVRDETMKRVKAAKIDYNNEQAEILHTRKNSGYEKVNDLVANGASLSQINAEIDKIDGEQPGMGTVKANLYSYANSRISSQRGSGGKSVKTHIPSMYRAMSQIEEGKFKTQYDLEMSIKGKVSEADRNKVIKHYQESTQPDTLKKKQIEDIMMQQGLKVKNKDAEVLNIYEYVKNSLEPGKMMSQEVLQRMVSEAAIKVDVPDPDSWFGFDKEVSLATAAQEGVNIADIELEYADIPDYEVTRIKKELAERGLDASHTSISTVYRRQVGLDKQQVAGTSGVTTE